MKQLRQKFSPIRKGLERGEQYLLMYRSKPLGIIRPYSAQTDSQYLDPGEPVEVLPAGEPLRGLPSPKTISFGSTLAPSAEKPEETKPLDKLRVKRAFI